ncbi:hypothetical protein [Mesorhizobium sp. CAU 1741]|uniref:hypothetical protein n=1 Tax=Mesorhizobium sp. CAU 1741 TaxID=3140366 RepID=UPI00325A5751
MTKDEDLMNAIIKGSGSTKELSSSARATVSKKLASFKLFRSSISTIGPRTAYLIVRNPSTRFIGVVYSEDGINNHDSDLAVMAAVRKNQTYSVFERFWSDGIFWRKYVDYAFRKRIFGGPQLDAVEDEQQRSQITTNRDGWINGRTWYDQANDGADSPLPSTLAGGHRGEQEELRTLRGAVNF